MESTQKQLKSLSVQAEHRLSRESQQEIRTSDAQLQDLTEQSNVAGKQLEAVNIKNIKTINPNPCLYNTVALSSSPISTML